MASSLRKAMLHCHWALARRIAPGVRNSQYEYRDLLLPFLAPSCRWLDVGCGRHVFGHWMTEDAKAALLSCRFAVGVDVNFESLRQQQFLPRRVAGDLERLPFSSGSFDLVTANMVVEHLQHPSNFLGEAFRILRPGGHLVFHTVNVRNPLVRLSRALPRSIKTRLVVWLDGRPEEDVFPVHYLLNEREAINRAAKASGFQVLSIRFYCGSPFTAALGLLSAFELVLLRIMAWERLAPWRVNLCAVLRKPESDEHRGGAPT